MYIAALCSSTDFVLRRNKKGSDKLMSAFLTNLEGAEWKKMRAIMSGVFTSGKLKLMTKFIAKVGDNLEAYIAKEAKKGSDVDMKVVGGYMAMDGILSAGFGVETNSFEDPENIFRIMALRLTSAPGYASKLNMLKFIVLFTIPDWMIKFLGLSFLDTKSSVFFQDVIKKTYNKRKETGERRNDFIDMIVDAANSFSAKAKPTTATFEGEFEKDAAIDTSDLKDTDDNNGLDMETLLVANAILFFFAGFETTSTGMTFITHQIVHNQEVQDKMIEEIDKVMGGADGELTFERIQELKYMEKVIYEALRLQPAIISHERHCIRDYKVPDSELVIPKGRFIHVYCGDLTTSKDNFANPDTFDPENFDPSNKPNKFGLMVFGQGPRNCVGMR